MPQPGRRSGDDHGGDRAVQDPAARLTIRLTPEPPRLVRAIGRWDLVGILVNGTIGAGILGLPGRVYALVGPWSLVACLVGGVLMALVGACYAEAGSRFARSGGSYLFVHAAFGPGLGFVAGWTQLLTRLLAFAAIANLVVQYAAGLWPPVAGEPWRMLTITLLSGGLGGLVYAGVQQSTIANNLFTAAKLLLLLGFVGICIPGLARLHIAPAPLPAAADWSAALILLMFGLVGLDGVVVNGGEMRHARRDLPGAIATGVGIVVLVYCLVILACMAVVPDLARSQTPILDGTVAVLGRGGAGVFATGAILSMVGILFSHLFLGPRLLLAMAENRQLPPSMGRIHPRLRTPHAAVLVNTVLAWGLAAATDFLGALAASTMTRLLLYGAVAASVLVLRRRGLSETPAPLLLPWGSAAAVAALAGCAWVLTPRDPRRYRGPDRSLGARRSLGSLASSQVKGACLVLKHKRISGPRH